ncbi:uncharacterized protein SOCE26_039580 [Sorangium cellulosum]|uniref:Uncharacterized protein n=1 Tax=Sorangium cellulosum TaxID=56 RepID=A0A2L0ETB5_SORCE|nr:hypothetical protein [Sorangium cellulosum]AUX42525.1 uncharacterized protein SOCE26_039580 [Sorangium cellulosum]
MVDIFAVTGVSEDPFVVASMEHAALRGSAPAQKELRELFVDLDRLRATGLAEGSWSRCATCGDPGPDPLHDPETPDDFELH